MEYKELLQKCKSIFKSDADFKKEVLSEMGNYTHFKKDQLQEVIDRYERKKMVTPVNVSLDKIEKPKDIYEEWSIENKERIDEWNNSIPEPLSKNLFKKGLWKLIDGLSDIYNSITDETLKKNFLK